jgi:hypothetical protein
MNEFDGAKSHKPFDARIECCGRSFVTTIIICSLNHSSTQVQKLEKEHTRKHAPSWKVYVSSGSLAHDTAG